MAIKICEIERCMDCHRSWNTRVKDSIGEASYIGYVEDRDAEAFEITNVLCDWCNYG